MFAAHPLCVLSILVRCTSGAVTEVLDHFGKIDILVHNAGGDIGAAGVKPTPNEAVMVPDADVQAVSLYMPSFAYLYLFL